MKTIDHSLLDSIAGGRGNNGGDRADNSRKNKGKTMAVTKADQVTTILKTRRKTVSMAWWQVQL